MISDHLCPYCNASIRRFFDGFQWVHCKTRFGLLFGGKPCYYQRRGYL